MEIKPETKVEIILWDWFKATHGQNVKEVYFNKKNLINNKIFKVKGIQEKPDMIISFRGYFNKLNYLAIEIKDAIKDRNVFDSGKIFGKYYLNYVDRKTKYFIEDKEIKIDHFAVATQFSKYGRLFLEDNNVVDNFIRPKNDVAKKMFFKSLTLPRCEYRRTRDELRQMWSRFKEYRTKIELKIKPSLGIIESDILMNFHPEELKKQSGMVGKPILSCMMYKDWIKKPEWKQVILEI